MKPGDRVRISEGWWITQYSPLRGFQTDGTERGTIMDKRHDHPNTTWVELDNGTQVTTATTSLELES